MPARRIDGSRKDVLAMYATKRRSPYIQNFNVGIDRELAKDWILNVSYVGTKGTRLWGGINLNTDNIFNNEFLDAFNLTRAGGNAPLFDRMLNGLNIPGAGVVNGSSLTGSAALRAYTGIYTPPTGNTAPSPVIAATALNTLIANGSVGHVADFLNRSTSITGKGGGFVRNGGLPENFFVLNPQFNYAVLYGNPAGYLGVAVRSEPPAVEQCA